MAGLNIEGAASPGDYGDAAYRGPGLEAIVAGETPPWLARFLASVGRGTTRFDMIRPGDAVTVGVSGGKDSLVLSLALALRSRRGPVPFNVDAARVEWEEFPMAGADAVALEEFFSTLGLPYRVVRAPMAGDGDGDGRKLSCYRCARERKRRIFALAAADAEKRGDGRIPVVAFGHHLDDFVETALFNLLGRGRLETMAPRGLFLDSVTLIRPLCLVREGTVATVARRLRLPVASCDCPHRDDNLRDRTGGAIASLRKIDRLFRENIFEAALADRPPAAGSGVEGTEHGNP